MAANRRPGGVSLPKFEPIVVDQSPAVGTPQVSSAGDVDRVAQRMMRLSDTIGRRADQQAAEEGLEAGAAAGMDPEFRRTEQNTAFGRAFDRMGSQVALSRIETEARTAMEAVFQEHGNNPVELGRAFDGLRSQLEATDALRSSAQLQASFGQMFDRTRLVYERQSSRAVIAAEAESAQADVQEWSARRLNDLDRMARQAGLDPTADAMLTGELTDLETALATYGPREAFRLGDIQFEADSERAGALSPSQITQTVTAARRAVASGRVMGAFSRETRLDRQSAFREDFLAEANAPDGAYADLTRQDINSIDTAMSRTIRSGLAEHERQVARQTRALERALEGAIAVEGEGLPAGAGVFERIARDASAIGADDVAQEALEAAGHAQLAEWAWMQPPAELEAARNGVRAEIEEAGSATPYQARQVATMDRVLTQLQSGLANDPLSTAVRAGIASVPPLTMANEAGEPDLAVFAQSLSDRADIADVVAQNYGLARPSYFTAAERRQITEAVATGDVERFAMAQSVVQALGRQAPVALAEIAPNDAQLAHLGGLLTAGAPVAAQDMARGLQLARVEGWQSRLPSGASATELDELRLTTLGDIGRRMPETAGSIVAAADAIYDARATRQGLISSDGSFDETLYRRALNEAAGAVYLSDGRREVQFGGLASVGAKGWFGGGDYQLMAPGWLRADRLDDVLGDMSEADMDALPGRPHDQRGEALTARDMSNAWYIPIGAGRYQVAFGSRTAENPTVALTETGDIYTLDLSALRGRIREAHPDWVR